MRRFLFIIFAAALTFAACDDKGKDVVKPLDNEIMFGKSRHAITSVTETYYGKESDDTGKFQLKLTAAGGIEMVFEIYLQNSGRLVSGDYKFSEKNDESSFVNSYIKIGDKTHKIESGTIKITTGDEITLKFDGAADGRDLNMEYKGKLVFKDESKKEPVVLDNEIMIGEKVYKINYAVQAYFGYELGKESSGFELGFVFGSDNTLEFEIFTPIRQYKLVDGEYKLASTNAPFTISDIYMEYNERGTSRISLEEFKIEVKEDTYTISFIGKIDGIYDLAGEFNGKLVYELEVPLPNGIGKLEYDGKEYELRIGAEDVYGPMGDGVSSTDLYLVEEFYDLAVVFELWYDSGAEIKAGTYEYADSDVPEKPFTFSESGIIFNVDRDEEDMIYFTSGELIVSVEGEIYTFTGEFETIGNKIAKITYTGELCDMDYEGHMAGLKTNAEPASRFSKKR